MAQALRTKTDLGDLLKDAALFKEAAYINGEWLTAAATLAVRNPANGEVVGTIPDLGAAETRRAIDAASAAFPEWRALPAPKRSALLEGWFSAISQHVDDLAKILTVEQGKPLAVLKEPVGVCAAITPWNFPNAMITRKIAPALAAGCTIVLKPSELTPFSATALAVLAERVGFPKGVINIVTGQAGPIGDALTSNDLVRKLSFTGSTRVGKLLMEKSAGTLKRLSLELGGNAPFIIFDDADIDRAMKGVMASKFRNAGQTCVSANRILVRGAIYDEFADKLTKKVSGLVVGEGLQEKATVGPLINDAATEKVLGHIDDARTRGAVATIGGGAHELGGHFIAPTVLTGTTAAMRIANEETFGPVAPLFRFQDEDEAIELANSTPYGLAAYFYTENIRRAWRVAEKLEFGMVGCNTGSVSLEMAPFGGIKQSGFGREGSHFGIEEYLQVKAFHFGDIV
ncbi:MAG: succinate-semialdehyde dehydrogenase (NADP(+)) [Acidobacteria bacterium]|nr:MAG: succinate-semialdehyde dehydrogenase (NADP(+)) [Acidobacteriota bacterium]